MERTEILFYHNNTRCHAMIVKELGIIRKGIENNCDIAELVRDFSVRSGMSCSSSISPNAAPMS